MSVANVNVTKVLMRRGNTAQNAAYTGVNGEVTVDLQAKTLRIHDGSTLGGFSITAGGGSYSNTNVAAYIPTDSTITSIQANVAAANAAISAIAGIDTSLIANAATQQTQINLINANVAAANALIPNLLSVSGNIIPSANVTYSLGNVTHQWRDLWVSNNTIYIGNTPIRVDGGTLLVNNSPVSGGSNIGNLQIDNNNNQLSFGPGESYSFLYMKNDGSETRLANDNGNVQISTIKQGLDGGTYYWTFDNTGNLVLPNGTRIRDIGTTGVTSGMELGNHGFTMDFGSEINNWAIMSGANIIQVQPDTAFNITFPEIAQWQFDIDGNLTIPGNINYANGTSILSGLGGGSNYGNTEVAAYLSTYTGVLTASRAQVTNSVDFMYGGYPYMGWQLSGSDTLKLRTNIASGDYTDDAIIVDRQSLAVNVVATLSAGNVITTNGAYWANGVSLLNGLASQSYVNTKISDLVDNAPELLNTLGEIAANLAVEANAVGSILNSISNTNANVTAANVNIAALQSNAGSQQNSIDTLLNRVDQAVNMTSSPQFAGLTTTANVEMNSNVHISKNLVVDGNINFVGNVTQTNITTANAVFTGDTYGFGALYAGVIGYTPLPYTVIQATADYDDYSQINFQNLNLSANASTEWVATAGNGTDLTNYIDFGIAGGAWNGTQLNSVGTAAKANDGWVYVLGNTVAGTGGNLVLGTIQPGKRVNILTGGPSSANIYSYFNSSGLTTANVYAANYLYANGTSILTGIGGTYSNTNVAGYLAGNVTTGNIQVGIAMRINGTTQTIDTANGSSITIGSRINLTGSAGGYSLSVTHPVQIASNLAVGTNSNAQSFYGVNYYYSNGVSILSGIGGTYSNVNVEAYIGGNIGAYQTFANANAATQQTSINSINANLGSFQTYANATFGGSSYGNASVAAYLPTYTGNIAAGNVSVTSTVTAATIVTTGTYGNITGANVISANTFVFGANGVNILTAVAGSGADDVLRANVGAYQLFANANAAAQAISINTVNANIGSYQTWANSNFGTSTYSNVNVEAYIGGNIGSYQIYANANAAAQQTTINSIDANVGAFQTYANATFSTSTYGNTQVASYLPTYTGNIKAGNLLIENFSGGYFANISSYGRPGSGRQNWRFYVNADINGPASWISFPDGTTQYTAYPGTSTTLETFDANLGTLFLANVSTQANIGSFQTFSNANAATQTTGINSINANLGAYQTFANANVSSIQNQIFASNANIGAFQTYANATFGVSSYGNTQVAAYLLTYPNANVATQNTTSANITILRAANFNSANAVISGGYISALTNASIVTATITTVNSTAGNVTTLAASNFSTANAVVTGGYATGLANISVTGNATVGNLVGTTANTTIIAGAYSSTFDNVGNVVLPNLYVSGNTTAMGIAAGYAPNRPAFRIYGGTPAWWTTANTNFKGSSIVVDYNQGGYFNSSTGVFTAPVAGLYQTTLNARIGSVNAQGQILVLKNALNTAGNALMMWEADTNTGTAVHFGISTVVKLVAGDILTANITAGNIQFDQNDSWTVTYIG